MLALNDVILLIISDLGGEIQSKTKLQKLCYFHSIKTGKDLGFRAHYYGPYSPLVEKKLDELEGIGLIEKKTQSFGEIYRNGFGVVRYDYKMTKYGQEVVSAIGSNQEKELLTKFLKKIKELGNPDYLELSLAAKTYFILKKEGKPLTYESIREKAKIVDWEINEKDINKATKLLEKLKLITLSKVN